jgi:thiol-disulfide isomerase/thioredoxin
MDPTLARLLEEDPMGKLFAAAAEASKPFTDHLAQQYPRLTQSLKEARESSTKLDFSSEEGVRASATTLRATYEELQGYLELRRSVMEALDARRKEAVQYNLLRRSGNALLQQSPVVKIKGDELPADSLKPYIVFWSAGWCFWCKLVVPTFARLSRFFDRCPLFFCADEDLRKAQGIRFIPQLVAYLPEGQVGSDCGGTAQELWDHLNLLITLGQGFRGSGTLVCDEQGCRIDPVIPSEW